jgi:hypothetical protein
MFVRRWDLLGLVLRTGSVEHRETLMDSPELVAVPCRECRRSPVEVLKRMRSGSRYLWCPQCRAIWICHALTSLSEPAPHVIPFGPSSDRRPF